MADVEVFEGGRVVSKNDMGKRCLGRKRMAIRPCEIVGDTCLVALTKGETAAVDASDRVLVAQFNWCAAKVNASGLYAYRHVAGTKSVMYMHRLIADPASGMWVDHIDGDTLNNRRSNLRTCTAQQNQWNQKPRTSGSSHFKGVCWSKQYGMWRVSIRASGKCIHVGKFSNEIDAALAYDLAADEHFGEFAWLNFPKESKVA